MRITKYLTDKEFKEVMAAMRLSAEHIEVARLALVNRFRLQEIANQFNMSKQNVSQTIRRVWEKFLELQNTPKDWVSIRVSLPPDEAERVLALEAELKSKCLIKQSSVTSKRIAKA